MTGRRERPWRKLRVVVEVTVPPNNRATERDLQFAISEQLSHTVKLRRPMHQDNYEAPIRFKLFKSFWPAFLRSEKGSGNLKRKASKPQPLGDIYEGL